MVFAGGQGFQYLSGPFRAFRAFRAGALEGGRAGALERWRAGGREHGSTGDVVVALRITFIAVASVSTVAIVVSIISRKHIDDASPTNATMTRPRPSQQILLLKISPSVYF